jgi:hypothetical protein
MDDRGHSESDHNLLQKGRPLIMRLRSEPSMMSEIAFHEKAGRSQESSADSTRLSFTQGRLGYSAVDDSF